jgi:phosphomannomutase/phosphoglucomutase
MGEDYYGFDDAPLVALRALQIFSHSDQTVAEIFDDIPKLVATPEIILSTPDAVKFAIIEEITAALQAQYEVMTVDGVRALFPHGWGLVRASNTQPAIALRFEAYTAEQLVEYMHIFKAQLDKHPEIDQAKLDKQIAAFSAS